MALNPEQLQVDLETALNDAAAAAYKQVFKTDVSQAQSELNDLAEPSEDRLAKLNDKMSDITSTDFGRRFSEVAAPRLASIIDGYVRSITLVPNLTAPNGPVTGTIAIT